MPAVPQQSQAAAPTPQPTPSQALTTAAPSTPGAVMIPDINTSIISRGDNLWRLSQRIYGDGLRYTVIFGANRGQIRNPNLIYPGQVFVLPSEAEQKSNRP